MISMDGDRSRRILSPRMPSTRGRFASLKSRRMVHFESQLERDFCYQLEFDSSVLRFREQPATVSIRYRGKWHRYTPDLAAERRDGITIYEVKPRRRAVRSEMQDVFDAAQEHFSEQGYRYQVVTEDDIRREPLFGNIKMLLRYAGHPLMDDVVSRAQDWLRFHGPISIAEFAEHFDGDNQGLLLAYALIAQRFANAPIHTVVIDPDSWIEA